MAKQRRTHLSTTATTKSESRLPRRIFVGVFSVVGLLVLLMLIGITTLMRRGPRDGSCLRLLSEIPLPATRSLLSGTDYATVRDHVLFVSYSSADALLAIDINTYKVRVFASGLNGLHGVAFSVDPSLAFVSVGKANKIAVLNMPEGVSRDDLSAGEDPDGIIYDAQAGVAYAGNGKSNSGTLVPAKHLDESFTLPLGGSPEYPQADEETGLIYQPLADRSEVVVIDPATRSVIHRFAIAPCEEPTGSAIDSAHQVLFIGCSNRLLSVMRLRDGKIVTTVPIGRFVDVVAWDPGLRRIYTANSAGTMTVIGRDDAGGYTVLDTVRTRAGGHTLAIDPETHRVYVVCSGLRRASVIAYEPTVHPLLQPR